MKMSLDFSPVFNPMSRTLDYSGYSEFQLSRLLSVVNVTQNEIIYQPGSSTAGVCDFSGSVLTLSYDTTTHSPSDVLMSLYDSPSMKIGDGENSVLLTENKALATGNAVKKFRDGFVAASPDLTIWNQSWTSQGGSIVSSGGDAFGSKYLKISMDPLSVGSEYILTSKDSFRLPNRLAWCMSASNRLLGQECEIGIVGVDGSGNVESISPIADMPISGTITVASNIATINFATPHPYKGGDRVIVKGCSSSLMNAGPLVVTVVNKTQITVPITVANATYNAGGFVEFASHNKYASNASGILIENATPTNGTFYTRRNGSSIRYLNLPLASTAAIQSNTSPYTDAFNGQSFTEIITNLQETQYSSRTADSVSTASGGGRFNLTTPDEDKLYKIRVRVKNLNNFTIPVGRIVSISKSGTTTATITTDVPHGLTVDSYIHIFGVRDQVNFANVTSQTVVKSVISSTQFTCVVGSAVTASSSGGCVILVQGSTASAAVNLAVQSISRTSNVMTITMNTTASTALPGEMWQLHGCDATSMGLYDGAYKVLKVTGTTYELESIGDDFTTINCGGAFIKRTDFRIHFLTMMEYTRHVVEMYNQHGYADAQRALPVLIVSGSSISTVSTVTASNMAIPLITVDVASAAITTTTTTAAIVPSSGSSYSVSVPVAAVSGTTPTLDLSIEESDDTGTNWYKVYDFPRITTIGMYRSPQLRLRGNRIRYVQTVTGTTPSFTRAINRLQANTFGDKIVQIIDRTIVPNTASSASPSLLAEGCQDFNLSVRVTAQTTAATIDIQVSDDNTNWATVAGGSITTAVGLVRSSVSNIQTKFIRAFVTSAGTGITLGEVILKGVGK